MSGLSRDLQENINIINIKFKDCEDIKSRKMELGGKAHISACIFYVEVAMENITVEQSAIGKLLSRLVDMEPDEIYEYLDKNALGITDVNELYTLEEASMAILIGDGVLFIDGYNKAIKIKSKGYPMMGLTESRTEKVIRGSREGFADSVKTNTSLVRKRLRTSRLKVKEKIIGKYSNTTVAIVYMEGLVRQWVLNTINKRLDEINIEELTDTGIIEEITKENVKTPFPEYQTIERPDKAAEEIIKGRVVLFVDNSPIALLMPTNLSNFFQTADDYYNKPSVVTFARLLRYIAAFLAVFLPGIYLAITNYHPEILPLQLLEAMSKAREGVPFPAFVEVLFMEISFELLREAGIRIPGYAGSAMSIVGGLIVGQASVTAGLVSPVIVIVVALTALASYGIPNEELSSALRLCKYIIICFSAVLGLYGVALGGLGIFYHLSGLTSFDFPYMYPFTGGELNDDLDFKDTMYHRNYRNGSHYFYRKKTKNKS